MVVLRLQGLGGLQPLTAPARRPQGSQSSRTGVAVPCGEQNPLGLVDGACVEGPPPRQEHEGPPPRQEHRVKSNSAGTRIRFDIQLKSVRAPFAL